MKTTKFTLAIVIPGALLILGLNGMVYAFHSGGVANCDGCHSMHAPKVGSSYLLIATDTSSTCLTCHAHADTVPSGYHVMTYPVPAAGIAPVELTPGGDFAWLLKNYTYTVAGVTTIELGQTHGHNVIAADFGITVDSDFPTSPTGTFVSGQLACSSCHDPHGKYRRIGGDTTYIVATTGAAIMGSGSYNNSPVPIVGQAVGSYRMLAGIGYTQNGGSLSINYPGTPIASSPFVYNQSEVTNQVRVAYGYAPSGNGLTPWGLWCATCHPGMHSAGNNLVHPVDQPLGSTIANIYQTYVSSGNLTGSIGNSYLSLVPFFENNRDYVILKTHASNINAYLNGPGTSDQVSCLSCHRAHASGWPNMMRWNMQSEFITFADGAGNPVWPGLDTTPTAPELAIGRMSSETMAAYYNRLPTLFGAFQRVLCNKCHAQD